MGLPLRFTRRGALGIIAASVLLWISADFVYSSIVDIRMAHWEASHDRDADGVQLGHEAYTLGDGETALLLVHGIGDSPRGFGKMAPRLAESGFTCRVMRLPGFAEPAAALARVRNQDWIRAVATEVAALSRAHPHVVIVAHSLGAAVTIAQLLEQPRSVDALVLLAPLVEVSDRRSPVLPARTWHRLTRRVLRFSTITETPFPIDARDPQEREYPDRFKFTPVEVFDELFALIDHNRGRAGELKLPLMTVLSPHDRVTGREAAERFHQEAGSTVKVLRIANDAAHAMIRDLGWEGLTDDIAEFVRANVAGGE